MLIAFLILFLIVPPPVAGAILHRGVEVGQARAGAAPSGSRRALWVVRDGLLSPKAIDRMVADAAGAGITDLFVQVRGRGDAYYVSSLAPLAPALRETEATNGPFDPLARVLDRAHARNIRVHAWINVYLASSWSPLPRGHVVDVHPEWLAVDAAGRSMGEMSRRRLQKELTEGAYLDPANPEVTAYLVALGRELATNYPLDGIHLDYVRYPHMDVGYSGAARREFRARTGFDPVVLSAHGRSRLSPARKAVLDAEWAAYKADCVTRFVRELRTALRQTRPGMALTAAVKPDPEIARRRYGQDWVRWIREDLVDVVTPMMYSPSLREVRRQVALVTTEVPGDRMWAGIAVYNQSLSSAARKIEAAEDAGFGGISIFSYNSVPGGGRGLSRLNRGR